MFVDDEKFAQANGIRIYSLPDCDEEEDEDFKKQVQQLRDSIPFAVVGANAMVDIKGKTNVSYTIQFLMIFVGWVMFSSYFLPSTSSDFG